MFTERLYEDAEEWCKETTWRLDVCDAVDDYDIVGQKTDPDCIRVRLHSSDTEDLVKALDNRGFVIYAARLTEYTELEVDIAKPREIILH